jgi:hypothetical protein
MKVSTMKVAIICPAKISAEMERQNGRDIVHSTNVVFDGSMDVPLALARLVF